jgi:hypothetical protein
MLDGSAFVCSAISEIRVAEGNPHFQVCGNFVVSRDGSSLIVYFGRDTDIVVPHDIRVLSVRLFFESDIRSVEYGSESQLRRIEHHVFAFSPFLKVLCIPSLVEEIDGSAFASTRIEEIRIADDNAHFRVSGPFLLDSIGTSLIRYFDEIHRRLEPSFGHLPSPIVRVTREIEMISAGSFERSCRLQTLEFEPESQLRCIGEKAFANCWGLSSMSIPASTEVLCRMCLRNCSHLAELRFEAGSKLHRIESDAFRGCGSLTTLSVPMSVKGNDGIDLSGVDDLDIVWV